MSSINDVTDIGNQLASGDTNKVNELTTKVNEQGNLVRNLKSSKASKVIYIRIILKKE